MIGSALGIATVAIVIFFTRRRQKNDREAREREVGVELDKHDPEEDDDSSEASKVDKPQLHSEEVRPKELDVNEIYELASPEPVGSELNTPMTGTFRSVEHEWPLPISPLPLLFAMTEMRDEKAARSESPKHATYYNP